MGRDTKMSGFAGFIFNLGCLAFVLLIGAVGIALYALVYWLRGGRGY
jgi:hypothetical protein